MQKNLLNFKVLSSNNRYWLDGSKQLIDLFKYKIINLRCFPGLLEILTLNVT